MAHPIKFVETAGAVLAHGDHSVGAACMSCLETSLKSHRRARRASLEANSVAQNSFDARDVRRSASSAGDGIPIGINADRGIAVKVSPAQCLVEQDSRGRVDGRDDARSHECNIDPKLAKPVNQRARSDIAAAPAPDI
jgi:hypothetical protein